MPAPPSPVDAVASRAGRPVTRWLGAAHGRFGRRGFQLVVALAAMVASAVFTLGTMLALVGPSATSDRLAEWLLPSLLVPPLVAWPVSGIIATMLDDLRRANAALAAAALTDPLTGLLNRRGLMADLADPRPGGPQAAPVAVAMVDVDGLKAVNDRHGHGRGDDVLRAAATALAARAPVGARVVRLGGDEFAVVADGLTEADLAERVDGIVAGTGCAEPAEVTVSWGTSVWRPGEPLAEALGRADDQLYRRRQARRDRAGGSRPDGTARRAG